MIDEPTRSSALGLVAGLGVGAGIFYYRSLVKTHLERDLVPHILVVHADVRKVMSLAAARQAGQLADYLAGLLRQLAGGAQIATIPAFSPQVCAGTGRDNSAAAPENKCLNLCHGKAVPAMSGRLTSAC